MQGGPECWRSQHDQKSRAGRGFAAPSATDIRDFPPGGYTADGGPNPQRGVWQQIVGRSPITGPALLRAAQASQTPPDGGISCPKGSKDSSFTVNLNCPPHRRPKLRLGRTPMLKDSKKSIHGEHKSPADRRTKPGGETGSRAQRPTNYS